MAGGLISAQFGCLGNQWLRELNSFLSLHWLALLFIGLLGYSTCFRSVSSSAFFEEYVYLVLICFHALQISFLILKIIDYLLVIGFT